MVKRKIPPLTALRAFEAAARRLSFKAAAEELNITQSAVSHQIGHLEAVLGVALFHRRARRVELSEAGALYYPFLHDAFDRIAQGTALLNRADATGDLTVQVYVTVAVRWLIPRLHQFQASNPDVLVRFSASQLSWEFDPEAADLGMIYARKTNNPDLHYTHLFDARLVAVCSPTLAQRRPGLRRPSDLAGHTLLQLYTAADDWSVWLRAAGIPTLRGRAAPKFDSYLLALEAAIDGQGVAVAPHFLITGDLRTGRLVQPFDIEPQQPGGWYVACLKNRSQEQRIDRFRKWLVQQVAGDTAMR